MKTLSILNVLLFIISIFVLSAFQSRIIAQSSVTPVIEWQCSYGGTNDEVNYSIETTSDNGFLLIGNTKSIDGDVKDPIDSDMNAWIVKLDSAGVMQWEKSLGGSKNDLSYSGEETSDHGYFIGVESISGDGTSPHNYGGYDFLATRLDSKGDSVWTVDYGGTQHDHPSCVRELNNGGYIMTGGSCSNDFTNAGLHHGSTKLFDFWLMKLDTMGNIVWNRSIGGILSDLALYVQPTADNGFVVVGQSQSNDGDIIGHHGSTNFWDLVVMKVSSKGKIEWQKSYGGSADDIAHYVIQTPDGGYMVAGCTMSNDGDVTSNHGGNDYWILKLRPNGAIQWQKTYGGTGNDVAKWIEPTSDGNYVIAGESASNNGDVTGNHGMEDFWIIKINPQGHLLWQQSFGGSVEDFGKSVRQLKNGSLIVSGTSSSNDGDVSGHHGSSSTSDFWVVQFKPEETRIGFMDEALLTNSNSHLRLHVYPNPVSNELFIEVNTENDWTGTVQLRDLTGQLLYEQTMSNSAGMFKRTLSMNAYPCGTYFLMIHVNDQFCTRKIQKQ